MRNLFILLLASIGLSSVVTAQELTTVAFRVGGYNINEVGYPTRIVPGPDNKMYYTEWWVQGSGRRYTNRYLQALKPVMKDRGEIYDEMWARPLTEPNEQKMDYLETFSMEGAVAVVGNQPNPNDKKGLLTVVRFFDHDGRPMGPLQTMTPFRTKTRDYEDFFTVGPNKQHLLWLGYPAGEKPKKAVYFCAVWRDNGRKLWREKLRIPPNIHKDEYVITQGMLDKRGNAFFLMLPQDGYTGTPEDSLLPPKIVRYDYREGNFDSYTLDFPGYSAPLMKIQVTADDMLNVFAIISRQEGESFTNGGKTDKGERKWSGLALKRYSLMQNMALKVDTLYDFDADFLKKYKDAERQPNFRDAKVIYENNSLYLLLEEAYNQLKPRGTQYLRYDVATFAFNTDKNEHLWTTVVEKRQRDYAAPTLIGYTTGVTDMFLHLVYLTERGARGKVVLRSINRETGGVVEKELISNERGEFLFFPERSAQLQDGRMVLMGIGNPNKNDYFLLQIKQLP